MVTDNSRLIHVLKGAMLKMENELETYNQSYKYLVKKAKEIKARYKISIDTEQFLTRLSKVIEIDRDKAQELYQDFLDQVAKDDLFYKDIFEVDFEKSTQDSICYALKLNKKINAIECFPEIGSEKLYQVYDALVTLGDKAIVEAIRIFENFFSKILYGLILQNPDLYLNDRTITYGMLIKTDIEELKTQLIKQRVQELMYDVNASIDLINERLKLGINNYQQIYDNFIELSLRRNVIVHNDGVINKLYFAKLPKSIKSKYEDGDRIILGKDEVSTIIEEISKFIYLIFFLIGENEDDYKNLDSVAFDFLKKGRWELAEFSYALLMKVKGLSNQNNLFNRINYLNAKKHIVGLEKVYDEICSLDISGMTHLYSIAKNLLLENNEAVTSELETCYPEEYNSLTILTWPIFIEYRKTDEYKNFRNRHIDDFEPYEYKV